VIARDSAYQLASRQTPARIVARELGVQAVLGGTLTEQDGSLTLDVELLGAADGNRVWGERFSRATFDVQFLQAELASAIASRLRLQVAPGERAVRRERVNPEAYQLYLRGRYLWNKRTAPDLSKSVEYFTQATERDPSFALAYTGLADAHALLSEYHTVLPKETYGVVKAAVGRALALDDELAEAHASLAYVRQYYEWDFSGAEAAFQRALELEPRYATAHQWYAELLSAMGRHDEALIEIRRATDLDPFSLIANSVHAYLLYFARHYNRSIAVADRVLELDRNFPEVYIYLKRSYEQLGRYDQSIAARQTRRRLLGLESGMTSMLRAAAAATDRRRYWQHRLAQELLEGREEGLPPFDMAEILAQTGDTAQALDWLEQACRDNDFMMVSVRVAPLLDPLRAQPRFQALLAPQCRVPELEQGAAQRWVMSRLHAEAE
jgi:tetratricopeptide (TPR) repeat protein